jgi:hypothetical protein
MFIVTKHYVRPHKYGITYLSLSRSLLNIVNYILGFLNRVIVSDVANVSEVYAASIFMIVVFDHEDGRSIYLWSVHNITRN